VISFLEAKTYGFQIQFDYIEWWGLSIVLCTNFKDQQMYRAKLVREPGVWSEEWGAGSGE
jgi:hypothetical protein